MEAWLARARDLASKIFQNDGKSFQNLRKYLFIFIFLENLEKIQPVAPRAGSGQLGPAPAGSAQLRLARSSSFFSENPLPPEGLKKMIPGRENFYCWDGWFRSRWLRIFLNFLPFSIFLNRMMLLSAAVARTPLAWPFVKNDGM